MISTMGEGTVSSCASVIINISRVRTLLDLEMLSSYLLSERTKNPLSVGWGIIHIFRLFKYVKAKVTKAFIKLDRKEPVISENSLLRRQ